MATAPRLPSSVPEFLSKSSARFMRSVGIGRADSRRVAGTEVSGTGARCTSYVHSGALSCTLMGGAFLSPNTHAPQRVVAGVGARGSCGAGARSDSRWVPSPTRSGCRGCHFFRRRPYGRDRHMYFNQRNALGAPTGTFELYVIGDEGLPTAKSGRSRNGDDGRRASASVRSNARLGPHRGDS